MPATLELKYFNSFWLKKMKNIVAIDPAPVSPYANIPSGYDGVTAEDWYIEEARIRGGYNNTSVDFGVKAFLAEEDPVQQTRISSMIYSGLFNSRTGINNTNQFSVGKDITRSADPANGSIQKLYAEDTNLIIFQEDKVSRALIDKDAIYSAEGNASITSTEQVMGQIVAYAGEYGISDNPESFAVYGYRKYFTDRKRNSVIRLSRDGMTEISDYGMHDFFRDELSGLNTSARIIGGWDMHTKNYALSIQPQNSANYKTLTFDESVLGWTTFLSFKPRSMFSIGADFYTINNATIASTTGTSSAVAVPINTAASVAITVANASVQVGMKIYQTTTPFAFYGIVTEIVTTSAFTCNISTLLPASTALTFALPSDSLYKHYTNTSNLQNSFNKFYGITSESNVSLVLNANPSLVKNFKTINYEGSVGWELASIEGLKSTLANGTVVYDSAFPITAYTPANSIETLENALFSNEFKKKENKYFANLVNNSVATQGVVIFGQNMTGIKGFFATVKMNVPVATLIPSNNFKRELFAVSSNTVPSSY